MVVEAIPFNFPRIGRMNVKANGLGNFAVIFDYPNGRGVVVMRSPGEDTFRLLVVDADGKLAYLPEVLGEGAYVVEYLIGDEVDVLLTRISRLSPVG